MTPRSLFNIILKVFGIFFIKEAINAASILFSSISYYFNFFKPTSGIINIFFALLVLALYIIIIMQLLFKTNAIIDKFKLDQGFDEHEFSFDKQDEFRINLSTPLVLRISLTVIGAILLADEIPNFCRSLYVYLGEDSKLIDGTRGSGTNAILAALKVIIGLLLIGERNWIINFIEERRRENAKHDAD